MKPTTMPVHAFSVVPTEEDNVSPEKKLLDSAVKATEYNALMAGIIGGVSGHKMYNASQDAIATDTAYEMGHAFVPYEHAGIHPSDSAETIKAKLDRVELQFPKDWYDVKHHTFEFNPALNVAEFIPNAKAVNIAREGVEKPALWRALAAKGVYGAVPAGMSFATGMGFTALFSPNLRDYIRTKLGNNKDTQKLAEAVYAELEKRAADIALAELGGK